MTLAAFLEHWSLGENPFRGEEARQDPVFGKLSTLPAPAPGDRPFGAIGVPRPWARVQHPDFEKIAGDFARPSAAIVFGEKGSGKTAIRLQLGEHIAAFNAANPGRRALLVAMDQLGEVLDRFAARVLPTLREKKATLPDALTRFRLVDHIDAVLGQAVPRLVDAVLEQAQRPAERAATIEAGPEVKRTVRGLDRAMKLDLLALQAVYDRPEHAEDRARGLRRRLGFRRAWSDAVESLLVGFGWVAPAAVMAAYVRTGHLRNGLPDLDPIWTTAFFTALGIWLIFLFKRAAGDRLVIGRVAHRLRKQIRVIARSERSFAAVLRRLPPGARAPGVLPLSDAEEPRLEMLERLRRVLGALGYASIIVVVDRVDEPGLIKGDVDRMRAVVWPLLNNTFLQRDGIGVKLLLPVELRHVLLRESSAFFQGARLDKQCLIERLAWTGAMLYDLCTARLNACRPSGATPITLRDLFADDVTRQDLIDALDQMHQPRDAFKLLYQCIAEHCSNVTADEASHRIPRAVLDAVRKQQVERVRQLSMGVRPA
ncbi:MAG: hypothetical protein JNK35_02750 [Phycisphaerae bacterium]|nr:hypothetical protein [Phycisphaerae bacterium]